MAAPSTTTENKQQHPEPGNQRCAPRNVCGAGFDNNVSQYTQTHIHSPANTPCIGETKKKREGKK